MRPETAKGWWYSATTEQRLAQIDGGIECGLTVREVAMVMGRMPSSTLAKFALDHGRRFGSAQTAQRGQIKRHARERSVQRDRAAYFSGNHIDPWGVDEADDASQHTGESV